MKLTGKCREEFEYTYNMSNFNELDETLQNARIIEFFDSLGFYIGVHPNMYNNFLFFINKQDTYKQWRNDMYYKTRLKATNEAIDYINKLYNETFS